MIAYGDLGAPHDPPLPPPPPLRTLKVNQLDAQRIDDELSKILQRRFNQLFTLWKPFRDGDECSLCFRLVVWMGTILRDRPSPGNKFQNVHYAEIFYRGPPGLAPPLSYRLKWAYCCLHIIAPYLAQKIRRRATTRWARDAASFCENALELARWVNLTLFLFSGVYRSLEDRILKIRLVHLNPIANRLLSLDYMHRFLLWNGLQELMLHVVPLFNLDRLRVLALKKIGFKYTENGCGFCGKRLPLTLPVSADCGHVFCYYCAALEMQETDAPKCPRCDASIVDITPQY